MFEKEIIDHAKEHPEEEVCGFILLNPDLTVKVERAINESPNREDFFAISPSRFLDYKINKNILGIYHSHPSSTERPSARDRAASKEMGIPYLIYSVKTEKFFLYYPESYRPPALTQRPHVRAFCECISIFKDYYKRELNINISEWNKNYWLPKEDKKANALLDGILKKNMKLVKKEKINQHDLIVFEIKKNKRLHVGIYLGDDKFIHQPDKLLSKTEILDERWQNKIKQVYRHPSLV